MARKTNWDSLAHEYHVNLYQIISSICDLLQNKTTTTTRKCSKPDNQKWIEKKKLEFFQQWPGYSVSKISSHHVCKFLSIFFFLIESHIKQKAFDIKKSNWSSDVEEKKNLMSNNNIKEMICIIENLHILYCICRIGRKNVIFTLMTIIFNVSIYIY